MDKALNQLIGTIYQIAEQKDKKEHSELMLQQNRAVKLFKARIKNLLISSVVVPKGTLCDSKNHNYEIRVNLACKTCGGVKYK